MNVKIVFQKLIHFFSKEKIDHALIGAFALKAYGYLRATQDVDFLVHVHNQEKIVRYLEALGYETVYRSKGFSNHVHALPNLARIDFVYVDGETAERIFAETRPLVVLEGVAIPVVKAEHLIALKVFAMRNDPERTLQEMADLQQLLRLPGIDRQEARRYFERYGQLERYREITGEGHNDVGV